MHNPKGALGIRLDYTVARAWPVEWDPEGKSQARNWLLSSHLVFNNPVDSITDQQLWKIAADAFNEMQPEMKQYDIGVRKVPSVMTVLAFGNKTILSSSIRGQAAFTYALEKTPVYKTMKLCTAIWADQHPDDDEHADKEHRNKGSCGEPMVAHQYYHVHDKPLKELEPPARVDTVSRSANGPIPKPPCGPDEYDTWGCTLFIQQEGLKELDLNLKPADYNLQTIAGGVKEKRQITLCSLKPKGEVGGGGSSEKN
ncbi:hypothetical protein B0H66DRAFT_525132 [Apodospora peruviana]|uniref:Uncharacterized protein n=1 Tax=Apodospora peruviana TaxID=516989 RepID=A0AAE0LY37_9PEZI|nr:hypothetical protein B0H66DRAFT_525132 [Apodospora peruviana]